MNVLISGVGIAGPTLAFWLRKHGFSPTLVESAPALRTAGYVIDFWGLGYDIAEKMGLLPDIKRIGYHMQEMRVVNDSGQRVSGFDVRVIRELTGGRYITLGRSDLSKLIYDQISGSCEFIFGDSIRNLRDADGHVHVEFERGGERRFDLVIGADGLHSQVRKLAFGPQQRYEKDLDYRVAAFETAAYRPRDEAVYIVHSAPDRQVGRFTLRDDRTLFLAIFRSAGEPHEQGLEAQKQIDPAQDIRRRWLGSAADPRGTRRLQRALLRSCQPDPHGCLVAWARRADRRRRLLRISFGRPGIGARNGGGLCPGR
jgi:2-polyprenyl-6-methoxyphenol hydroxylase-like FAD-dependent oxidoreductase